MSSNGSACLIHLNTLVLDLQPTPQLAWAKSSDMFSPPFFVRTSPSFDNLVPSINNMSQCRCVL